MAISLLLLRRWLLLMVILLRCAGGRRRFWWQDLFHCLCCSSYTDKSLKGRRAHKFRDRSFHQYQRFQVSTNAAVGPEGIVVGVGVGVVPGGGVDGRVGGVQRSFVVGIIDQEGSVRAYGCDERKEKCKTKTCLLN